ncbi:MAG TPA: hypothetical protein VGG29_20865 [Caulobacteraceae bacterium]|jgi:hypothetical protein
MPTKRDLARRLAIQEWTAAAAELKKLKERELALRFALIIAEFGAQQVDTAGTSSMTYEDKSALKVEVKRSAKVDQAKIEPAIAKLVEAAGDVGQLLADRLIAWKASASITELLKLKPEHAAMFDDVISIELGAPSLEYIPAK